MNSFFGMRLAATSLLLPLLSGVALAQAEVKLQSSFEAGEKVEWVKRGNATISDTQSHSGKNSLQIVRHKDTEEASWTSPRFDLKAEVPYRFSAWMKSDKVFMPDPSFAPEVHVVFHNALYAKTGEVSFADYWKVTRDEGAVGLKTFSFDWKYFEKVIIPPPSSIGAWVKFEFSKTTGTAWMDDVKVTFEPNAVVEGSKPRAAFLRLWPARGGEKGTIRSAGSTLFSPGEPVEFFVRPPDGNTAPAKINWRLRDSLLRTLDTGSATVSAGGALQRVALPGLDAQTNRWLRCDWRWEQNGKAVAERTTTLMVLPKTGPAVPGVFGSYGNPGDYELLKRLGVTIVRSDIFWRDNNQPSPDKPIVWDGLMDGRMAQPAKFGLKNLAMLSWQSPKWAWMHPEGAHNADSGYPAKPEALRQAAFETASRYKNSVQYWQLGNEVNLHEPEQRKDYIANFVAFSAGIKAADPKAVVVLGSQNRGLADIEAALKEGALPALDAVDYHYGDRQFLRELRSMLDRLSPQRHIAIWQTELGFFTQDQDDVYATDFIKIMATNAGEGVENGIWCWLGGIGAQSEIEEDSPTLTRGTYLTQNTRMPSQLLASHALVAEFIQGAKPVKYLEWGRVKGYLFRDGEKNSAVIWSEGLEPVAGTLSLQANNITISDWTGRQRQLTIKNSLPLVTNRRPWLLSWQGPDAKENLNFAPTAPLQIKTQRARVLYKGTANNIQVSLAPDAAAREVTLDGGSEAAITPSKFTLKPGETRTVEVKLAAGLDADRLTLDVQTTGDTQSWVAWEYNLRPALTASVEPLPRSNRLGDKSTPGWRVRVVNNGSSDTTAQVALTSQATTAYRPEISRQSVRVPRGQSWELVVPLGLQPDFDRKYGVQATVQTQPLTQTVEVENEAGFMGVARVTKPPVIDGDLGDWKQIQPALVNSDTDYWRYHDKLSRKGLDDLSARLFFSWDAEALYFAADVADDVHVNNQDPKNIWNGDSVEIGLQPVLDSGRVPIVKVIVAHARGKAENMISLENVQDSPIRVQSAAVRRDGHTLYEARIPWTLLAPLTQGSAGMRLRGAVMLNEDDGHGRAAYMNWFGNLTYPTRGEAQFTDLTLVP